MPQVDLKDKLIRMNLDDDDLYIGRTDYSTALNISNNAEVANDIAITNITGNQLVTYTLHAGTNKTIGAKADVLRNRVYGFYWNSNGYHSILIYNKTANTITKLIENLTDTGGIDILKFTQTNKILHIDIIYRDEGDLLIWTEGTSSIKKLNVTRILSGIYGTIKLPFIELAKMPPIKPITATYGTDVTRNANSLRKKLIQATYRWVYDDFEKSTFTTYSKIPLPIGYYGSDNDIDNTKNNFITFTVETGDVNVTNIEIAVRFNISSLWNDFVLVISLNKAQLSIPSNSIYNYLFYNDSIYPPIPVEEAIQLFDWVPKKAKSLCLPNGNVVAPAAITEGYDNYPLSSLRVTITAANVTNIPPDTTPPSLTYTGGSGMFVFTVSGSVPVGTVYKIYIFFNGNPGIGQTYGVRLVANYTSIIGDTINDVANVLYSQFNSYSSVPVIIGSHTANYWQSTFISGSYPQQIIVIPGAVAGGSISTEKTWLWNANYIYGIVYKDEQGRIMPGVTTFINPTDSNNDFLVTTPSFSLSGGIVQTPVITAQINHLPPVGAVTFAWVRRRVTYDNWVMYETADYQSDTDYLYFNLANINKYKLNNSQFIYSAAPITSNSRIKIIAGITASAYNGNIWNQDYEILGTVTKMPTGGNSPADDVLFIKVKKPTATISPTYTVNMLVMVYTPMLNPTDIADSIYWEWAEEYGIYAISGVNYHRGMTQDQTASLPSIYVWSEGDVYFHNRKMYPSSIASGATFDSVSLMDSNWSDFFSSAVNDNSRGITINPNARETFFPEVIRFGLEYQLNTNINQTNRFKEANQIAVDRSFGSILKMSVFGRGVRIGQQFKLGYVPIFNQISKDSANNNILAATDVLLNPVQYFEGNYGIGDCPESWVDFNYSSYGVDNNRGVIWRLSRDGITVLSVQCKINSWASAHLPSRGSTYKVYGGWNAKLNSYIVTLEATGSDSAYTLSFNEDTKSFNSFLSYNPEMMCTLGNLLISFKNGSLYTHDGATYNNFYGVQYASSIQLVFNDKSAVRKKHLGIGYKSKKNKVWYATAVETNTVNAQTGLTQQSSIIASYFKLEETNLTWHFLRDVNSRANAQSALVNGDYLGGNYIKVNLEISTTDAQEIVSLTQPYITYVISNRNF